MREVDCQERSYNRVWDDEHVVADFETPCARVQVLDSPDFGTTIFLNGEIQSSAADQELYHEALTVPLRACATEPIRRALIVGGGELCTLRAVLNWPNLEHVDMIDYDGEFVQWCKSNLVDWHRNTFMDERAHIMHEDIFSALEHSEPEPYDAIIVDMTDISLNMENFITDVDRFRTLISGLLMWLAPHGSVAAYMGMWIPAKADAMIHLMNVMRNVTAEHSPEYNVQPYRVHIPSFGSGEALFALANEFGWSTTPYSWPAAARHFHFSESVRSVIFDVPAPAWWNSLP